MSDPKRDADSMGEAATLPPKAAGDESTVPPASWGDEKTLASEPKAEVPESEQATISSHGGAASSVPSDPESATFVSDHTNDKTLGSDPGRSSPGAPLPAWSISARFDQRYRIDNELARGGMGRVVIAHDKRIGREVAIKEMLDRGNSKAVARFIRESVMTARLQHPGIIPVYEIGQRAEGEPFIVMRRILGKPLDELIAQATALEMRLQLLPRVLSAIEAIAFAHAQRVIHRDLKPANILVGSYGDTLVIDWGLAKDLSDPHDSPSQDTDPTMEQAGQGAELTMQGAVMGTPTHMAPEQARGEAADERADVYALGAVLYHVLSGAPPFRGRDSREVLRKVLTSPPEPLEAKVPDLPTDLVSIVRRAMAQKPDERFPNAKALADELRSYLSGRLVASHTYSTREIVMRFVKKNRVVLGIIAASLAVLTTVGIISVRDIVKERRIAHEERDKAEAALATAQARGQELLLGQARAMLSSDPSGAVRLLEGLSPDLPGWGRAHLILGEAVDRGLPTQRFALNQGEPAFQVAFSPDGTRLLAASGKQVFVLTLLPGGNTLAFPSDAHTTTQAVFSADGAFIAHGGDDGIAHVTELATGQTWSLPSAHGDALAFLSFFDGGAVLVGDQVGHLRVWPFRTGNSQELCGSDSVRASDFQVSGSPVASGSLSYTY
ncbi:MAG: protein kinase, partial [Deltaproteobacteria bacterium]|nr:protein kinase [Deltaproteobacteria bacterium]